MYLSMFWEWRVIWNLVGFLGGEGGRLAGVGETWRPKKEGFACCGDGFLLSEVSGQIQDVEGGMGKDFHAG